MDMVYASREGGVGQYLTNDSQMDEMLKNGANLYVWHKDTETTELLATPEDGYLLPKPKLQKVTKIGGNSNG